MKFQDSLNSKWLLIILLIPILIYTVTVSIYAVNIPFWDDYDAILGSLSHMVQKETFLSKISSIVERHNEHRIATTRLFSLISILLFGVVNFNFLIALGTSFLLGIFYIIVRTFKNELNIGWAFLIPLSFLFFNFQYYENADWAMASIQNNGVIFFTLASIYTLYQRKHIAIPLIFAVLATFTSGNGFLAFIIGIIILIDNKVDIKIHVLWLVSTLFFVGFNFYGLSKNPDHPSIFYIFGHPLDAINYTIYFMGSYVNLFDSWLGRKLIMVAGLALIGSILYLIYSKKFLQSKIISYFLLFLLLTTGLTVISRAGFGIHQALSSRYALNSTLFFAFVYMFLLKTLDKKFLSLFLVIGLIFSVGVFALAYKFKTPLIKENRDMMLLSSIVPLYPNGEAAFRTLKAAERNDIYTIPNEYLRKAEAQKSNSEKGTLIQNMRFEIQSKNTEDYILFYNCHAFEDFNFNPKSRTILLLREANAEYAFTTTKDHLPDLGSKYHQDVQFSGFYSLINKTFVKQGTCEVGVKLINPDGRIIYQWTGVKVKVTD